MKLGARAARPRWREEGGRKTAFQCLEKSAKVASNAWKKRRNRVPMSGKPRAKSAKGAKNGGRPRGRGRPACGEGRKAGGKTLWKFAEFSLERGRVDGQNRGRHRRHGAVDG